MSKPFYLTTTLPYVNAEPHIGFALELVQADIIVRYRKLMGDDVFFNTGTDEHGLKILRKAQEEGKDVQQYVDELAAKFRELPTKLGVSSDIHFIRTTDAHHKKAAQEFWKRCEKDIYKKTYKGLYCVGDEAFVKETDLVNGKCPNHPTLDLIEIEEENYFFALSKYEKPLLDYLSKDGVVVPEWRRQEAIKFVQSGLEDFSISRQKERLPWGIPVPGDDSQVMYVWFDALINYISTLGWPHSAEGSDGAKPNLFEKFWQNGETLQLAGKDQVRFQSVMWQAMLMSAGLKTTDKVLYHGFITSGGQKMSKSIGNVVDPIEIINEYGADALRYFLARRISPFEDSDFTMERFKEAYSADLVNGIGNFVARIMKLAETNLSEPVRIPSQGFSEQYVSAMEKFDFQATCESISQHIAIVDKHISETVQPFRLVKSENAEERKLGLSEIQNEVIYLATIAKHIEPIMPDSSKKIMQAIRENKKPANLFPRKE